MLKRCEVYDTLPSHMANQPHKNKRVVSVPMSKDMKAAIVRLARKTGTDVGAVIREAIRQQYSIEGDWKHHADPNQKK
jgi:hypothetical protein